MTQMVRIRFGRRLGVPARCPERSDFITQIIAGDELWEYESLHAAEARLGVIYL